MITLTEDTVVIHRLVQAVIRAAPAPETSGSSPADTALDWLDQALPPDPGTNVAAWPLLRTLVPHTASISSRYPDGIQPAQLSRVQNEIGIFLNSQGEYQQALTMGESALRIFQARLEPGHPDVATALANLASTHSALGRAADALPLEQRARINPARRPRRLNKQSAEGTAAGYSNAGAYSQTRADV